MSEKLRTLKNTVKSIP